MANGRTVRQGSSDIDSLSDAQGIFEFDAEVANCAVCLCVTKQQLDRAEVAGFSTDLCCLCPAQRMGTISAWLQPDCRDPITHQASILAG